MAEPHLNHVWIGTSGWSYKSWEKNFYPQDIPKRAHFEFYVTQFHTVEINATFYRLPTLKMVEGWRDKTPRDFVYAIKGSRFITHIKKLANLDGALDKFFERLEPLQRRIGVILWQLPPFLHKDVERLDQFLEKLPDTYDYSVEFRHHSWLDEQVFGVLRSHRAAFVSVSSQNMPMDLTVSSSLVYIRFHGLEGGGAHDYTQRELEPWAEHIRNQAAQHKKVYAFFNNDANVRAPNNAKLLIKMLRPLELEYG